jgi:hypothetical protein
MQGIRQGISVYHNISRVLSVRQHVTLYKINENKLANEPGPPWCVHVRSSARKTCPVPVACAQFCAQDVSSASCTCAALHARRVKCRLHVHSSARKTCPVPVARADTKIRATTSPHSVLIHALNCFLNFHNTKNGN